MKHDYVNWVEINLSAIEKNTQILIESSQRPLMAVVKANAYGHGAVEVARAALWAGASWLAVARYCEARILREAGILAPILVLGMVMPEEVDEAIQQQVTLCLYDFKVADLFSARAKALGKPVYAHVKIDTGMGRLGVFAEDGVRLIQYAQSLGGIKIDGLFSHFSMAAKKDHPFTQTQISRFTHLVDELMSVQLLPKWVHLANSAASYYENDSRFNLVRAGAAIVGLPFSDDVPFPSAMCRSLSWKARLASCKRMPAGWTISYGQRYTVEQDEWIGALPVGYADGYHRVAGNQVLLDGQKVPVVGNVCMDQCMIRLPKQVPLGTEVVLLGSQNGANIAVEDLCRIWNVVEDDVTSCIAARVPRVYVRD